MKISDTGLAINRRFFHVLDVLKQTRKIRGTLTFTRKYNINYWNLSTVKKEPDSHFINVEWLSYLVSDYGVSAEYLLTGIGNIFKDSKFNVSKSGKRL